MLLIYKIFGIFLWYALPFLRQAPLHAAKKIGRSVNMYTIISVIYFLGVFILIPLLVYGISFLAWQVELVFCIVCLALIDFVIIVNVLQVRVHDKLPGSLALKTNPSATSFLADGLIAKALRLYLCWRYHDL